MTHGGERGRRHHQVNHVSVVFNCVQQILNLGKLLDGSNEEKNMIEDKKNSNIQCIVSSNLKRFFSVD